MPFYGITILLSPFLPGNSFVQCNYIVIFLLDSLDSTRPKCDEKCPEVSLIIVCFYLFFFTIHGVGHLEQLSCENSIFFHSLAFSPAFFVE